MSKLLPFIFAISVGCSTAGKTADVLQDALDVAHTAVSPAASAIASICVDKGQDSKTCRDARKVGKVFLEALKRADEAIRAYREARGDFEAAEQAVRDALEAGKQLVE